MEKSESAHRHVKFIVNGESFIITKDILDKFPDTILHNAVSFNKSKNNASEIDTKSEEMVVEFPNRDAKIFRCIRSYMETNIPIFTPDPIEKELLLRELAFYGFTEYEKIVREIKTVEELSEIINKKGIEHPTTPGSIPAEYLKKYLYMLDTDFKTGKVRENLEIAVRFSENAPSINLAEIDLKIKAAEIISRIKFAGEQDATDTVHLHSLFDTKIECGRYRDSGGKYQFLGYPGVDYSKPLPNYISNIDEFKWQFNLISMGLLENIWDLPFVVCGGSILYSLMRIPQYKVPDDIPNLSDPVSEFANIWEHSNLYLVRQRWPRRGDPSEHEQKLEVQLKELQKKVGIIPESKNMNDSKTIGTLMYLNNVIWNKDQLKKCLSDDDYKAAGILDDNDILRSYRSTDIDLFIVTRDPVKALEAIFELHNRIQKKVPKFNIVRTSNSVTFELPQPYRKIQIILRLYHSIQHVLMGFDLDCCCLGFNGKNVLATDRGLRAIKYQYQLVDTTRLSTTYENRLIKYAKRGFLIAIDRPIDIEKRITTVRQKIETFLRNKQYINVFGLDLLLAKLLTSFFENKDLSKMMCIKKRDYSEPPISATERRLIVRGRKSDINFVMGENIHKVLLTSVCKLSYYKWNINCIANLPAPVIFQTTLPHIQDRVDILYTGSFEPICIDNWY